LNFTRSQTYTPPIHFYVNFLEAYRQYNFLHHHLHHLTPPSNDIIPRSLCPCCTENLQQRSFLTVDACFQGCSKLHQCKNPLPSLYQNSFFISQILHEENDRMNNNNNNGGLCMSRVSQWDSLRPESYLRGLDTTALMTGICKHQIPFMSIDIKDGGEKLIYSKTLLRFVLFLSIISCDGLF